VDLLSWHIHLALVEEQLAQVVTRTSARHLVE
jgi:hypothetical protein